ncbi:hypothetical protein AB0D32_16185 [Micromonospora sp. NPDC048170]|uniref:hypothetical protein n=1 Tax=Micromonospora sp. NPDC048170 TaxID=3154819 RepID=UPI0033F3FD8D
MSRRRMPQWFHFGPWVFDIDAAQALIAATPRTTSPVDVTAWATAYGLVHLDNPNPWAVSLIGPDHNAINRTYAMTTDLTQPLIVAHVDIPGAAPAPLLIDGTHRLYRAWREHLPQLPAHLLTVAETLQVKTCR